jgi:hypothetical protein
VRDHEQIQSDQCTVTPTPARPGVAPAAFNSRLMQPLFTELANLLQNALFATGQMIAIPKAANSTTIVIEFCEIFFTVPICPSQHYNATLRAFRIHE